jgi:hypothetical protein
MSAWWAATDNPNHGPQANGSPVATAASSCTARTSPCPPRCSWPARSEPPGSTTEAHIASGDHSPASPAPETASRSSLPRWYCCSSRARRTTRTSVTSRSPCHSSTPNSAHGSKTPWNTCHAGKRHLCPTDEINGRCQGRLYPQDSVCRYLATRDQRHRGATAWPRSGARASGRHAESTALRLGRPARIGDEVLALGTPRPLIPT